MSVPGTRALPNTVEAILKVYRRVIERSPGAGGSGGREVPPISSNQPLTRHPENPASATAPHVLRSAVFAILRYSGVPFLLREIAQRSKVTIVVYHSPAVNEAKEHFRALAARYNVISLSDYMRAREEDTIRHLPPKSLIITFDDGHRSNFALKPLLEESGLPIAIFLCSGVVGTNRHYWWFHTRCAAEVEAYKLMTDAQRVNCMLNQGYNAQREFQDRQSLSFSEIEALKPWVEFQSHTVTHPILTACSDEKAEHEIMHSRTELEEQYKLSIQALAFPNGDYGEREIALARKAGYTCALTLDRGFNDERTDLFRLRRIALSDEASVHELLVKTSGLWNLFRLSAVIKKRCGMPCHRSRTKNSDMCGTQKANPSKAFVPEDVKLKT